MTRARVAAAALGVAAAAAFACCLAPARAAEGDFLLEAALEQNHVKLGEDAVLLLTLTNRTASTVRLPKLRLASDSVSVRVRTASGEATLTRLFGAFLEDAEGALEFRPSATPLRDVEPGAALQGRVTVPLVVTGPVTLTAVLSNGTATRLEARPVAVDVPGRQRVYAQVETTKGPFRIDLDGAGSYASVASFWSLAREGFFDGLSFHRVVAGVLAQTGDPRGNGTGGPGWYLPSEKTAPSPARGDVGLARGAHADSAGSQWFVLGEAREEIAGGYVRLGSVVEGLDAVDALVSAPLDPKPGRPKSPDRVLSVRTLVR